MDINIKLKQLRKQKGINQEEAADLLGVSLSSYQKYEREKNSVTPSLEVLMKLADFYDVTTDYLLGREPGADTLAPLGLEIGEKSALEVYLQLPEDKRQVIIDTMIALGAAAKQSREVSAQELRKMITKKFSCLLTSAGTGELLDDENIEMREFPDSPQVREADIIIPVDGNSMEPEISDGDQLCIKCCDDIDVGEIGVFIVDGKGYVKQKGEDRLISLNPEYDDIYAKEYKCVGKVIGKVE
ncbi:MAG: XRE family transcriptional regulator [Ruminococcus sp.]|uniref:XRE family transcriptional regulator n=1 Tax=Ruminococcus sp. TaxID=41978 RepID=UPI0025F1DC21|nr:XRE family transcriptional regulator [Ruminococcus sp.]MCR5601555.1 XRE family transcriptional regulator [Ruminococcus sp.]